MHGLFPHDAATLLARASLPAAASGLDFAAGTDDLVLDGPTGELLNNANRQGDADTRVDLASARG